MKMFFAMKMFLLQVIKSKPNTQNIIFYTYFLPYVECYAYENDCSLPAVWLGEKKHHTSEERLESYFYLSHHQLCDLCQQLNLFKLKFFAHKKDSYFRVPSN